MANNEKLNRSLLLNEREGVPLSSSNSRRPFRPSPPVDFSAKMRSILGAVGLCAISLSLYGIMCISNNNLCPPVFPSAVNNTNVSTNKNNTNTTRGNDSEASGIGVLMLVLGLTTLIPICIVATLQFAINIGDYIGTDQSKMISLGFTRQTIHIKQTAVAMLFASHFLSAWGDRMWQFAVPLLFMEMFVDNLAPTAVYALVVYLACVQFMPSVGSWVDKKPRLMVQRKALMIDNASVIGTSLLLCLLSATTPTLGYMEPIWNLGFIIVFFGVILLGISGELMNQAQTLAIERDWVLVIADEVGSVSTMNTWMRRIDLSCKVLAPWAVGEILTAVGKSPRMRIFYGAAAVGVWNAMAYPLELLLTTVVYHSFSKLQEKSHTHEDGTKHSHSNGHVNHSHFIHRHVKLLNNDNSNIGNSDGNDYCSDDVQVNSEVTNNNKKHSKESGAPNEFTISEGNSKDEISINAIDINFASFHWHEHPNGKVDHTHNDLYLGYVDIKHSKFTGALIQNIKGKTPFQAFKNGFSLYKSHQVFLASVAYSSLWCSVLDNGTLMTAYLLWRNVEPNYIGIGRGVGAIFGLLGTMLFPYLLSYHKKSTTKYPVEKAGLTSIWIFWLLLLPGLLAFFISGESNVSDYTVMVSMAVSRIGLWSFDLAETQIMQTYIVEEERGIINSTQTAMYQLFYVFMQIGGIIFSKPKDFFVLVYFSMFIVLFACCLFSHWYKTKLHQTAPSAAATATATAQ